jgi:hypothetical protein
VETFLLSPAAAELAMTMQYDLAKDELFQIDLDIVANVSKVVCEKEVWRQLPVYEKLVLLYPAATRRYRERARRGDYRAKLREAEEEVAKYYDVGWVTNLREVQRVIWNRNWSATRKFEWFEYQIKSRTVACNRVYYTKYYQEEKLDNKTKEVIRTAGIDNGVKVEIVWDPGIEGQVYREGGGVSWETKFYRQGYAVDVDRLLNPQKKKDIKMKERAEAGKRKYIRKMNKIQRRCELKQMKHMRRVLKYMVLVENSMNGWLEMTETDELLRNRFLKPDTPGYQARVPEFDYLPENLVQWKSKEFRVGEGTLEFVRSISLHEMSPDVEVDVTTRKLEAPGDDYYQGASPGNASEDESCPGPPPSDLDEVESEAGDNDEENEAEKGNRDWRVALGKFEKLNKLWTEQSEASAASEGAEASVATEESWRRRNSVSETELAIMDAEPSMLTL